ncbi:MAG: arabinose-5-phosphate isomerase [Spirosomataceae bacterium]
MTNLNKKIITTAQNVLLQEAKAIESLISAIDDTFSDAVEAILGSTGRLVISGIGKSAIIAQKIVATMNSTGQPAVFMHAADAIHGDLGMIQPSDIVLVISKSGSTPEIKVLLPLIKRLGNKMIALVSDTSSYLATQSDFVLSAHVEKEACPLNLAPTTSTTVALAMGDALAVCLLEHRSFSQQDFAKFHPGGNLGKRLYLKVSDIYPQHELPVILENASVREIIVEISSKRLGATAVVNDKNELTGIITDGDLRRMLNKHAEFSHLNAKAIMSSNPQTIEPEVYALAALQLMQERSITQLIVSENKKAVGFVHLHDLLKEGLG